MTSSRPVRWGFLGAGFVASRGVAPVMHASSTATLQVVAARDLSRAESLEPVRATTSYAEVCTADDVDAVYLSLPNDAHLPWVLAALEAGKHVLCEKPLGLDAGQVAEMTAAARSADRLLVEASWNRWHPRARRAEQLLAGIEGPVEATAWFTFTGVPADNYRLDPARGGGALYDVGCYAVGGALMALGEGTRVESATSSWSGSGVDLTTTTGLRSPRGTAQVTASFEQEESQGLSVAAPGFALEVPHPAFTAWREPSSLRVTEDGETRTEAFDSCDPYLLMVDAVSSRVRGGDDWVLPLTTSLEVARVLDDVREKAAP
jgi:predicted dehydrogenase